MTEEILRIAVAELGTMRVKQSDGTVHEADVAKWGRDLQMPICDEADAIKHLGAAIHYLRSAKSPSVEFSIVVRSKTG